MRIEPVFCQNCGRLCKEVHEGDNHLRYCSRDCAITGRLIDKYEGAIFFDNHVANRRYGVDRTVHGSQIFTDNTGAREMNDDELLKEEQDNEQ